MAGRRKNVLDVREMVRRFNLGQSDREVAWEMGTNRRTVAKYRKIARTEGWLNRPELPEGAQIEARLAALGPPSPRGPESGVEPYRARVVELRDKRVEVAAIWLILKDHHGFGGSYNAVLRFVHRLEPRSPEAFVRMEVDPGDEAQVDFGHTGKRFDPAAGRWRKAYTFVMTLSFSRHQYVETVLDQSVATWLALQVRAFEFFGGVPRKIVLDNLKAAITRACFHDPEVQHSYLQLAEHYGFVIAPCRIATPQHKGKVEKGGVHYVKRNALAGREFATLAAENAYLLDWTLTRAGTRDHGTTHEAPLARFQIERKLLLPLPTVRYELAEFRKAKLHPDCHVVFDKAYYSAPHRLIGQTLMLRATATRVEISYQNQRVASHPRATHAGQRVSNILHYPDTKIAGLLATPVRVRQQAAAVGAATGRLVEQMLADKPVDRLRAAQGVVNLSKRYGPARLETACRRALAFGDASYRCVSSILRQDLDRLPLPPEAAAEGPVPRTAKFARPIRDIASGL
jgi:transposase